MIAPHLLEKLQCLWCRRGAFGERGGELACTHCGRVVSAAEGIPDFLGPAGKGPWEMDGARYEEQFAAVIKPYRFRRVDRPMLRQVSGDVLEIGCGTCRLAASVERVPQARYFGIDPSLSFLRYASLQGRTQRIVRARAENLPLRDGCFDTLISGLYAMRYVSPEPGLREARRVLKKGGIFSFDLLNHWFVKWFELKRLLRTGAFRQVCALRVLPESAVFEFVGINRLKRLAGRAGFRLAGICSTPVMPFALSRGAEIDERLSSWYFRDAVTVHLGYDIIVTLEAR